MNKRPLVACLRWLCASAALLLGGCRLDVLSPAGDVGMHERSLIYIAMALMSVVVVPVIALTLWFAWRYRASNTKATYAPKWSHSTAIEAVMWGIPCVIIAILGWITWTSTHKLDPYRPLVSQVKPVTIEAVSLDWKWLFIYPDYGVASVNQIAFPVDTPVNFRITSGSVMNAFFIPRLGSQIYAMAGMQTKLHLIAREQGSYEGLSSNYSGAGFSDMHFKAVATSEQGFQDWIRQAKAAPAALDVAAYQVLEQPSERVPVTYYGSVAPGMFEHILHPHAATAAAGQPMEAMPAMAGMAVAPVHPTHAKAAE
ncbi:ubiquinol oxidase subunit II [Fulvimonas sp. R45]|uniref:ubiquinol oxidase subunit II n=1 Tax=Fulvimonas sp. R45 TaxID=3045937 RepID=UPI0031F320C6